MSRRRGIQAGSRRSEKKSPTSSTQGRRASGGPAPDCPEDTSRASKPALNRVDRPPATESQRRGLGSTRPRRRRSRSGKPADGPNRRGLHRTPSSGRARKPAPPGGRRTPRERSSSVVLKTKHPFLIRSQVAGSAGGKHLQTMQGKRRGPYCKRLLSEHRKPAGGRSSATSRGRRGRILDPNDRPGTSPRPPREPPISPFDPARREGYDPG